MRERLTPGPDALDVPVQRRFSDLDPLGHVNNVVFLDYAQEGRIAFLRALGFPLGVIRHVVVTHEITFRKPLHSHPDPVIVRTWIPRVGNSSYDFAYVMLDEHGDVAAEATTTMACVDRETGSPVRIPVELRAAMEARRLKA